MARMAATGRHDDEQGHEADTDRLAASAWPAPDERLVMPGTRYECIDGRVVRVPPAEEPHARRHATLGTLLELHAAPDYLCASDLLTRTSEDSDFASDVCLYPAERDPETGGRQLEELAFEIRNQQSMKVPTRKARLMTRRGVRRVFCVDLPGERVLEWSASGKRWRVLRPESCIEDLCLVRPLEVAALLDTTRRDAAVVAALTARKVPELEAALTERERRGRAEGKLEGVAQGKREALLGLLPDAEREALAEVTDLDELARRVRHLLAGAR